MDKTFHIITMGCQMNECDSDYLSQSLVLSGFRRSNSPQNADVVLLNTCAVRAKPEQKAFSQIGRLTKIKEKKPHILIGVVGCLAQKRGRELLDRFPHIDFIMGPREIGNIAAILTRASLGGERIAALDMEVVPPPPIHSEDYCKGRVSDFVSVMEGCNNFCTYCVVPYVRGREISRPPHEIVSQIEKIISDGVREITLLGQNVNSYKWTAKTGPWDFSRLLREVDKIEGLVRLRFTTSHPKDLSQDLMHCFDDLEKLCPHIHLPFQAGSNAVLKKMARGYSREHYLQLIENLKEIKNDIAITSDVMVGFPGETESDFLMTLDLIKRIEFDSLFSFKYSDREGTLAQNMGPKISENEKASRLKELQDLQKEISLRKNKEMEGQQVEVLVDGHGKRENQIAGRTPQNKIVNFSGNINMIGCLVNVKIESGLLHSLRGRSIID